MSNKMNTAEFRVKAELKHGNRFDYSKVEYTGSQVKGEIVCPKHGSFFQTPNNHLRGQICPTCATIEQADSRRSSTEEFVKKATAVHEGKYDYSRVEYSGVYNKVEIVCPEHGSFMQQPNNHLSGFGCSKCGAISRATSRSSTAKRFVAAARIIHGGTYDYDNIEYKNNRESVEIICKEHGPFRQSPGNHLSGKGCPVCGGTTKKDVNRFIMDAIAVHGTRYLYNNVVYINDATKVMITCPKHGDFSQLPTNHLQGVGCPKCSRNISGAEIELFEFVRSLCPDAYQSDRSIIKPFELDIVIPSKQVAFEYNGLYYHSDRLEGKRDNAHKEKTELCAKQGYRLIHIWEDDWLTKRSVVEKTIKHVLGFSDGRIGARACSIEKRSLAEISGFFQESHLQGSPGRGHAYVLMSGSDIVAAMGFSHVASERGRSADGENYELIRYAASTNVVGGASRLFSAFIKDHPECKSIVSYSDNDWFTGGMYEKLGFEHVADVPPDYKVVDGGMRRHKSGYRLSELRKKLGPKFDPLLTERENCRNNGLFRVYNSGLKKWLWKSASCAK